MIEPRRSPLPCLERAADSIPRRTARDTWRVVTELFLASVGENRLRDDLREVFQSVAPHVHQLLVRHGLASIGLECGSVLVIHVCINYEAAEHSDHLDLPLAAPIELAQVENFSLVLHLSADLCGTLSASTLSTDYPGRAVTLRFTREGEEQTSPFRQSNGDDVVTNSSAPPAD